METLFDFVPYAIYTNLYMYLAQVLCLVLGVAYFMSTDNRNLLTQHSQVPALLLAVLSILYIGLRPDGPQFGDSYFYRHTYYNVELNSAIDWSQEWLFALLTVTCRNFGLNHHIYFLIIEIGYVGCLYAACRKLLWENTWMAMLFCISAFSFFTYGVNGIRNGLALHIVLLAVAFLSTERKWIIPLVLVLCLGAFGVHRTSILPIMSMIAAYTVIKNPKWSIYFWVGCIFLSLVAGDFFQGLLGSYLSVQDARMSTYTAQKDMSEFSRTGFRWDFLLYSSVPVLLTYYVVVKRGIQDHTFNIISTTYILSNAVWILVNRMAYSNRLAYLSWFLYPVVIAYALIRLHIWEDQDRKSAYWLMGHSAFTIIMMLLGR